MRHRHSRTGGWADVSVNLIDFFDRGASLDPLRPCLIDARGSLSYRHVQLSSCRVANALRRDGIAPGTHVAVLSHNSARAFECVLGIIRAGCAWVPVNARNTVTEVTDILHRTDVTVLFYADDLAETAARILAACPAVRKAVCIDGPGVGPVRLDDWLENASDALPQIHVPADAVATLFCSGGTSGTPKGVLVTHRTWAHRIGETLLRLTTARPVHLVAAPMTHAAGGIALELMVLGASHVILPGFDPDAVLSAIREHRVTHLFLPPTALYRLLAQPQVRQGDYSSLRYFTYAAAPIAPDKLLEAIEVFGPVMCHGYGSTEMGASVCWSSPEMHQAALASADRGRLRSCGRPSPLARLAIVNESGEPCRVGEQGELLVRSYSLASGYYRCPEEWASAVEGGWFHSGDLGFADEEGWIYLSDRKKDVINSGGFKVYPSEIETVLLSHPAVQECAVIGVPHQDWGEAVKAVIEPKTGTLPDVGELERLCREKLSGYKIPKSFEIWSELPRSPVGKVLKRLIRERFWSDKGGPI